MITPPINPQGDRLLLPDVAVEKLAKLKELRAAEAKKLAREVVMRRLDEIQCYLNGAIFNRDELVAVILELVQTAVLADRSRQRDVLREVQANLPAWASLGHALQGEPT